jgi:hypothetical protein
VNLSISKHDDILKKYIIFTLYLFPLVVFGQNDHYYIMFSARFPAMRPFSIGGHAFVTWRREDSLNMEKHQHTYGFFPKKGMGLFNAVKGKIVEGYTQNSDRQRLIRRFIIEVDSVAYYQSIAVAKDWNDEDFNLFNHNCVFFMNAVVQKLALNAPRTKSCIFPRKPQRYIKALKKMNKVRAVKNAVLEKIRLKIMNKAQVQEFDVEDED